MLLCFAPVASIPVIHILSPLATSFKGQLHYDGLTWINAPMRTDKFTVLCPASLSHLHEAKKILLPVLSVRSEAHQSPKPLCPPTVLITNGLCSSQR